MSENQNTTPTQGFAQDDERTISLSDLWNLIWDHMWWYVFSVLVCLFIASFHLYKTPKTFSRTMKVIVDEDDQAATVRNLTAFASNYRRYSAGTNVDNELEAFTSPDLIEIVVRRLGLETAYVEKQFLRTRELYKNTPLEMQILENSTSAFSFLLSKSGEDTFTLKEFRVAGEDLESGPIKGRINDTIKTPVGPIRLVPTLHFEKWDRDIVVSWVNARAKAKAYGGRLNASLSSKQSSVVVLSMQDVFPSRAEIVLSTLLDVYDEEWINNKNKSVRNTSVFINDRLSVIERELGGIENDLKDYKQSHKLTDIQSVSNNYLSQSSTYSQKYFETSNQLEIAKFIKEYLDDPNHKRDLIPANSGLQNLNVSSQIADYNKALLERDRLVALSSESNPYVQDLNTSLDAMRDAIDRSVVQLISTLQLQVDKIEGQEQEVLRRIANTSGQELELLSIQRQQKVKEQLYIFLLQKREENELQSLLTVGNTRLIMRPNGGTGPISPNKMMILLIALVFGFGLPFAVFYLITIIDTSVKGRNDIARTSVPFLAEIPQVGLVDNYWKRLRTDKFDDSNTRIVVQSGRRNLINEAFRVLRTNLDHMAHSTGKAAQVIMLTSFNPNAGKTFTIINLAQSMALKGSKALLVDLDLRKATMSKVLKKNNTGVSSYLSGVTDDLLSHIENVEGNLDLLPVGSLPPNPTELLVSDRFAKMVETLRGRYEYIFFDCPPVDLVADTSIIASTVDLTILVIRAGLFDKRALPVVDQMYKEGHYPRLALILNGVDTYRKQSGYSSYSYGYGASYTYGYVYGEGRKKRPSLLRRLIFWK
ncbi:MAG: polysaccharide biosynthesis tyrosine autokinase [Bacteroidales bacterium]|nr:polysaccharide biosynthesis tyrosine autokinase [Bacteroidales bacterium]